MRTLANPALAFQALADPTRRAVLDLLRSGRRPAGHIAQAFDVSRPAVSKHLRLLLRAQLVTAESQGRHRYYRLNPRPLRAVEAWLAEYRRFWSGTLTALKTHVEAPSGTSPGMPASASAPARRGTGASRAAASPRRKRR